MNKIVGSTFDNQTITLDGNMFESCTFKGCVIEYGGLGKVGLVNCHFNKCTWVLVGAARNTIEFLGVMYDGMGEFGRMMVAETFRSITGNDDQVLHGVSG